MASDCCVFKLDSQRGVNGKHLMRFQSSETSVVKYLRGSTHKRHVEHKFDVTTVLINLRRIP